MRETNFQELLKSVREGGAILRGERRASRQMVLPDTSEVLDAAGVREKTRLSQPDFARVMGVSLRTVQAWERRHRNPAGPAAALLRVIADDPRTALRAIGR